jgi:hypothetical protein
MRQDADRATARPRFSYAGLRFSPLSSPLPPLALV